MKENIVKPEIYEINDHILCFYLGRDVTGPSPVADIKGNWVDLDWAWGVCSYVIYSGDEALIFDTSVYPDQGGWIRDYMSEVKGVSRLTVVNSHWHLDHIAGNEHYTDCNIISTSLCRKEMIAIRERVETATFWGQPALKVVLPNITFEDRLTMHIGSYTLEMQRFCLHTDDSLMLYIPEDNIILCSDMLEDTVPFILDIDKIPLQLKELERMKGFHADKFLPNHGDPKKIKAGGYNADLIDAVAEYQSNLLSMTERPDYAELSLEAFVPNAIEKGVLSVWEPYRSVHTQNVQLVLKSNKKA